MRGTTPWVGASRIAVAALALVAACGGRQLAGVGSHGESDGKSESEAGSTETGELRDPLSCEGPDAPKSARGTRSEPARRPEAEYGRFHGREDEFPIPLVVGQMQPGHFVRVGDRVYWADGWDPWGDDDPSITVYWAEMAANGPWVAIADDQPGVNRMISDGEFVYWVVEGLAEASGQLLRASLADEVEVLDSGLHESPRALTFDQFDGWVYYAEGGEDSPDEGAKLLRIRPDGGDAQVFVEDLGAVEDIDVDETHVWWASGTDGSVGRAAKDGGDVQFITQWQELPFGIEVGAGFGWTIGLTGIQRIEFGEPPYWIDGHSGPYEIAIDSSHAYLVNWNIFEETHLGWIHRYPLLDGEYDSLAGEFVTAKASPKPISVAVDEHAVYWSTADEGSGEGGIWMLCKSAL